MGSEVIFAILLISALLIHGCIIGAAGRCENIKNCYEDHVANFSVIYPEGSSIEGVAGYGVGLGLYPNPNYIGYEASCAIHMKTRPETPQDAEAYANSVSDNISKFFITNNYTILSKGYTTVNGKKAYEFVYTWNYSDHLNKVKNVVFMANGTPYLVECSTRQSLFEKYDPEFESIIKSLNFTN
jgi:hypothetical protein